MCLSESGKAFTHHASDWTKAMKMEISTSLILAIFSATLSVLREIFDKRRKTLLK
jgi:hypothetical protein